MTLNSTGLGIGTATPAAKLIVRDGTNRNFLVSSDATQLGSAGIAIGGFTDGAAGYAPLSLLASAMQFGISGTTAMTLNATGLGVGVSPTNKLNLATSSGSCIAGMTNGTNSCRYAIDSTGPYIYSLTGGAQSLRVLAPTGSTVFTIDGSGNVGIGVTPSAWGSNYTAIELTKGACIWGAKNIPYTIVGANVYNDATNEKYVVSPNAAATKYQQAAGVHTWSIAPSGTAGNAITFTQAMTLDASGNLGVGVTPSYKLDVAGTVRIGGGVNPSMRLETGTNTGFIDYNNTRLALHAGSLPIDFVAGNTVKMTLDTSGNLSLANGNVVMTTSGKGIDFSATTSGSGTMTSELLNDYEEGTFTPTIAAASGTPTTTTVNSAVYTKIGRIVVVQIDISIINKGTASSSLIFSLPFNQTAAINTGAFRETSVTGFMGVLGRNGTTDAFASMYDNTTPWVNGYRIAGTYTYYV